MVNSAPVVMPRQKRSGNHAQKGETLMANKIAIIRPTMMKAARRVPMLPRMRGRKGPAMRIPTGPMAALTPISQAGMPCFSISSGRS